MDINERALNCGKIAHDITHDNIELTGFAPHIIYDANDLYHLLIRDEYKFGVVSIKTGQKMTILPERIVIISTDDFTAFEYLTLEYISRFTHIAYMQYPCLPPPKIYMKSENHYTVKEIAQKIRERFLK